jgi:peroxiredoxin
MKTGIRYHTVFFLLSLSTFSVDVNAQFSSTINCLFPNSWEGKQAMVVAKPLDRSPIIDTITILNRGAIFTINLPEPCPAYLWVEGNKDDVHFFVDSPRINIGFDPGASVQTLITGSSSSEFWADQIGISSRIREAQPDLRMDLFNALQAGDSLTASTLEQQVDSLQMTNDSLLAKTILENPLLASNWYLFASNYFNYTQTLNLFGKLSSFSSYPSYQKIKEKLARKQVGNKATDFNLPTAAGTTMALSGLKNTYILLDFSNRYFIPCQKRHRELRKLYKQYHSLGLEIVTVSFEFNKTQGEEAIRQDHLPWIQVLDLMDSSSVIKDFAIERMPDNVLLDASKTMIGRDLSARELDAKLNYLLKKK